MPKYRRRPRGLQVQVRESVAAPPRERVSVVETPAVVEAARATRPGRLLVKLITAGWSLNGNHYGADVLREAARNRAFAKGTQAFVDHATDEEYEARPAGSIRNLAAVLTEDARWDEAQQALMAEVRLFAPWREVITDMAEHIGMSIRAWVYGEPGEVDGQSGFVVSEITAGRSVDFVTQPAAGGAIVSVLESVGNQVPTTEARNAGHWFEARIHSSFTEVADRMFGEGYLTREERITLSSAVGDGLAAFAARIEADAPHLYERDPYHEPDMAMPQMADEAPAAAADETIPTTVRAVTEDATDSAPPPAPDPPDAPPESSAAPEDTTDEPGQPGEPDPTGTDPAGTASTEEQEMTDNPGAETPASPGTARQVIEAEVAEMRREMALMRAREAARGLLARTLSDGWVPPATVTRITESLMERLPLKSDNTLDETELVRRASNELTHAEGEIAEAMQAAGVGRPRDLGTGSYVTGGPGLDTADLDRRLEEAFLGLGNNEKVAKTAAKGRD